MQRQHLAAVNLMAGASGKVNTFECHNGRSTLDYIMIPEYLQKNVLACQVGGGGGTMTLILLIIPVSMVIDIGLFPRLVFTAKCKERIRWDKWGKTRLVQEYQIPLDQNLREVPERGGSEIVIERSFERLIEIIHEAAKVLPRSRFKKNLKPYWTDELNRLKKDKMYWFKKWKEGGHTGDVHDPVRIQMKVTKKVFMKRLRALSREYEEDKIARAANLAEFDRDGFWKMFKSTKGSGGTSVHAIKSPDGIVRYEMKEILKVWRDHFDALSTPKHEARFNDPHFHRVTNAVNGWAKGKEVSEFLENPVTKEELSQAIRKLNQGKAPGHDGITAEHLKCAGPGLAKAICSLFNLCIKHEYVPVNFRKGIQVPLYKGKNTCSLNPDNYRGITLLSTFNKLFEVVIWGRISH